MEMDYTAWLYRMMLFEQSLVGLTEEERQVAIYNRSLLEANNMAHSGSNKKDVQDLMFAHGSDYATSSLNWFNHGGDVNTSKLVRETGKYAFKTTGTRINEISGKSVHPHLIHDDAVTFMHTSHANTQESLKENGYSEDSHIKIYRGMNIEHPDKDYVPNDIESWSASREEAMKMTSGEHTPVLYSAKVKPSGILWSHLSRDRNKFIPHDDKLVVKKEHTVIGDRIFNIKKEQS